MMPEPGRQAAHVFLDAVSAWDDDAADAVNASAARLAFDRLNEIGALTATFDDETDELTLRDDGLCGSAMVVIRWLALHLAAHTGRDVSEVIADVREFVDTGG